jgi:hypothetical protein
MPIMLTHPRWAYGERFKAKSLSGADGNEAVDRVGAGQFSVLIRMSAFEADARRL